MNPFKQAVAVLLAWLGGALAVAAAVLAITDETASALAAAGVILLLGGLVGVDVDRTGPPGPPEPPGTPGG